MTSERETSRVFTIFLAKLFLKHVEPLLQPYIFQEAKSKLNPSLWDNDDKKLRDKIDYYLKKLQKRGLIRKIKIHARLNAWVPVDRRGLVDLIILPARPKPLANSPNTKTNSRKESNFLISPKVLIFPRYRRFSQQWYDAAKMILTKPLFLVSDFEREQLALLFESWMDDVKQKLLLFKTPENTYEVLPISTRFTDEARAKQILAKYNEAIDNAKSKYDKGVFLTITLPNCFSIRLQQLILSFMVHRLKALIRKRFGENKPHICANEPQKSLGYHKHIIIFGIDFIMDKKLLTLWLDKQLERFLSKLGDHIKRTINKNLSEDEVELLNRYGKIQLRRYQKWKKKKQERAKEEGKTETYTGPVNFVTKISLKGDDYEFHELPPDAKRYLENSTFDGGTITVSDYIRKYIVKNVYSALDQSQGSEEPADELLAWYWLTRSRFFTCSPSLVGKSVKPPPSGWIFVGSFTWDQIDEILSYELAIYSYATP